MDLVRNLARLRYCRAYVKRDLSKEAESLLSPMARECIGEKGQRIKPLDTLRKQGAVKKLLAGIEFPNANLLFSPIRDLFCFYKSNPLRSFLLDFFAGECVVSDVILQARYQALMDELDEPS